MLVFERHHRCQYRLRLFDEEAGLTVLLFAILDRFQNRIFSSVHSQLLYPSRSHMISCHFDLLEARLVRRAADWRESVQGVAGLGSIQYREIRYCCGCHNGKLHRRNSYGRGSTNCACVLGCEVPGDGGCGCGCVLVKRCGAKVPMKHRQAEKCYKYHGHLNPAAALR
jgi:hypothetical protein